MNCQTARQTLELLRPVENASSASDEAEQHVRYCLDCQDAVRAQQQLDLRIGRVCRDVSVPVGLKERLLAGLFTAEAGVDGLSSEEFSYAEEAAAEPDVAELARVRATGLAGVQVTGVGGVNSGAASDLNSGEFRSDREALSQPAPAFPADRRFADAGSIGNGTAATRRRWLVRVGQAVAAVCLMTAIGGGVWWSLRPVARQSTLDDVTKLAIDANPAAMSAIFTFSNGVVPKKPGTMSTDILKSAPLQLGELDVAVFFFTIRGSGGKSYEGRLVVMPLASVSDVPSATSFPALPVSYKPPFATTAWVEGDRVYVCCVKNGGEDILLLLRRPTV